jgi:hypothetical protein
VRSSQRRLLLIHMSDATPMGTIACASNATAMGMSAGNNRNTLGTRCTAGPGIGSAITTVIAVTTYTTDTNGTHAIGIMTRKSITTISDPAAPSQSNRGDGAALLRR